VRTIIFLLLLLVIPVAAQDKLRDSLRKLYPAQNDPEVRYKTLKALQESFDKADHDSALHYARVILTLVEKMDNKNRLSAAWLEIASHLDFLGKYAEGEEIINMLFADPAKFDTIGERWDIYNIRGSLLMGQGNLDNALKTHLIAARIAEEAGDKYQTGSSMNNLGTIYKDMGQYDLALIHYRKALKVFENIENSYYLGGVLNNLGTVLMNQGHYDSAMHYYDLSLKFYKERNDFFGMGTCYTNLGGIYFDRGEFKKVLEFDLKALEYFTRASAKTARVYLLNNIGEDFMELGQYDSAMAYSMQSLKLAKEFNMKVDIQAAYLTISDIYAAKKDFEKAYEWYKKFQDISDTIRMEVSRRDMLEMQAKYETDSKQKQIEVLNEKNERKQVQLYAFAGGLLLILLLALITYNRYRLKQKANRLLELRNSEIQEQKAIIEAKNKDITDSIRYAQRIQEAILPSKEKIKALFPGSFVFFRPKDIVSGDFYWLEQKGALSFFAAVDCTGHGVPGAIMSVIGYDILSQGVNEKNIYKANLILDELNKGVAGMFSQKGDRSDIKDGMDIALCVLDREKMILEYSGAFNNLYMIRDNVFTEYKADKIQIGSYDPEVPKNFSKIDIPVRKGDHFYVFTDGYADQFGGPMGKKLKYKQLQSLLLQGSKHHMGDQRDLLERSFDAWMGELDQVDDVCIIGIRV